MPKIYATKPVATDPNSTVVHPERSSRLSGAPDQFISVKKRDGSLVAVDPLQISLKVASLAKDLQYIDPPQVAQSAIDGLYDGVTTQELDNLLIQNAAMRIGDEPEYSKLAARLQAEYIEEEVAIVNGIGSFLESIERSHQVGLLHDHTLKFVKENQKELEKALIHERDFSFEYFGIKTVYDRYLLREPEERTLLETPQYFFMRVACGLAESAEDAIKLYDLMSKFEYMPSTPTLFNSGTRHSQMSSCYLLDSPQDDLDSIYRNYKDIALLSKFAGGIGVAYHRVRARGSLIKGTNGKSNGIVPFLKTLDSSVAAVNQGGKRKGAACVYLETWHADITDFLALRNNTGDHSQRTHNLNLANWIPDLFMNRVKEGKDWSLFDPKDVPELVDTYGSEFETIYEAAERDGLAKRTIPARDLYGAMMKALAETGNGWITFKDASNLKCNQTGTKENVVHLSNLCTEIIEVTNKDESAVCNLGSVNLSRYVVDGQFDFDKLAQNVETAVKFLDRVIDINFYPIPSTTRSNEKWRPVGLGVMGYQDVLFKLGLAFEDPEAIALTAKIQEEIYFHALQTSVNLAKIHGPHATFDQTRAAKGNLQFDLWGKSLSTDRWMKLKEEVGKHGLRNSLMIAIAPTATIASIVGSYECIEPQVSNLFKRETLSGEFLQVNGYLVQELRKAGLWTKSIRAKIKLAEGSIQGIQEIPESIRRRFKTAWEIPMRTLIDLAAERGPFIDQSQSLNLFMESPTIGKLSSMYAYAWSKGLKTTYYLRSRSATKIKKTTVTDAAAVACSLENPDACESCQ